MLRINQKGENRMNYEEKILELLKKATAEELERLYYFIKGYIENRKR